MARPPCQPESPDQPATPSLAAAIESYRHDFDWPPSSFANTHIAAILSGENPRYRVFFEFTPGMLSAQREILDQWDTPFRFEPPSDPVESISITSAGPDRTFDTKDDIRSY